MRQLPRAPLDFKTPLENSIYSFNLQQMFLEVIMKPGRKVGNIEIDSR